MVGSCSIHSMSIRGTKAEFFQLGTIYFSRSFRLVHISKMYRFEKRRNFFSNSFVKRNCETFYVSFVAIYRMVQFFLLFFLEFDYISNMIFSCMDPLEARLVPNQFKLSKAV